MIFSVRKAFAYTLMLCSLWSTAFGDENTIVIASYDAEPWIIRNAEGEFEGITSQFSRIGQMVGDLNIVVKPMPFDMLALRRRSSDFDVVFSYYQPKLAEHSEILGPAGRIRHILCTRGKRSSYFGKTGDKTLKIGVLRGVKYALEDMIPDWWTLVEVRSEEQGMLDVYKSRLDAMIMTDVVYKFQSEHNNHYKELKTYFMGNAQLYAWVEKGTANSDKLQRYIDVIEKITFNGKMVIRWMKIDKMLDLFNIGR